MEKGRWKAAAESVQGQRKTARTSWIYAYDVPGKVDHLALCLFYD